MGINSLCILMLGSEVNPFTNSFDLHQEFYSKYGVTTEQFSRLIVEAHAAIVSLEENPNFNADLNFSTHTSTKP